MHFNCIINKQRVTYDIFLFHWLMIFDLLVFSGLSLLKIFWSLEVILNTISSNVINTEDKKITVSECLFIIVLLCFESYFYLLKASLLSFVSVLRVIFIS